MKIETFGVTADALARYARIPIAFDVDAVLDVEEHGNVGEFVLGERQIHTPYVKDYDALAETPMGWMRFDTSNWGLLIASIDDRYVGGVVIACDTPGLDMLESRSDMALLWDIRVVPAMRRRGVGAALFEAAEAWALTRNCGCLKVETQNINVAACRFYAQHGCVLRAVRRGAYPDCPDEIQLLWFKELDHRTAAG